jgi:alpha-galactosidase
MLLGGFARALAPRTSSDRTPAETIEDGALRLEFDARMQTRVSRRHAGGPRDPVAFGDWSASEYLLLAKNERCDDFELRTRTRTAVTGPHGSGSRLTVTGVSSTNLEKTVAIEFLERYPGFAIVRVSYRNLSDQPIKVRRWVNAAHRFADSATGDTEPRFWSYAGSTHADRRDWVQPVKHGYSQENFMGMTASDYGGGTPIVDVWRRDGGLAIGHLELEPRLVSLPVSRDEEGVNLALSAKLERTLAPGERLETAETFIAVHARDYFATLDAYRRIMADRGLASPKPPAAAYESVWCAWGYQRDCTIPIIEATLPKVEELGLGWAVLDDGWQSNVGDWGLDRTKFPGGEADMKAFVGKIRARNLKPRLWYAPLAVAPGSDVLHDHTDMLLRGKDGAPQLVSWWNSFYLCPGDEQTVAYTQALIRKFIGEWGYAGLKIDGQHLNGVAPCYNPAHKHARPEESVEKLPEFLQAIYRTALEVNPEAVVEVCLCGTTYSFFNMRSMNSAPASDPESSWQVRHKGKTMKALMGPSAAFAGDHVEMVDGGDDFASTVGIGAIISTKFTWPIDPKPKDSFLLTPEREKLWRKWITLYKERELPRGVYRGELYDIGFDKPETHVVEKSGRLYYAFYGRHFSGPVELRGLGAGSYRVRDYFNDRELGTASSGQNRLTLAFDKFCVLEAIPA